MKVYKNVDLSKDDSNKLKEFLKNNKIKFETSGFGHLVHFEVLVNSIEENKVNNFLDTLGDKDVQFMVHSFRTESVVFRGTEEECLKYINDNDSEAFPLELYWASKGDKHYIENKNSLDEDETDWW